MAKLEEKDKEEIRGMIADKLGLELEQIKADSHFENDLGVDSLDHVEILMELEKMFNIHITDNDFEEVKTVNDLYVVADRYLGCKSLN